LGYFPISIVNLLRQKLQICGAYYLNASKFWGLAINKIKEHILTKKNLQELAFLKERRIKQWDTKLPP
jgi:hypothetical protein